MMIYDDLWWFYDGEVVIINSEVVIINSDT